MARRKGSKLNKASSFFYAAARATRDARAIQQGPKAIVKRMGRKWLGRMLARLFK